MVPGRAVRSRLHWSQVSEQSLASDGEEEHLVLCHKVFDYEKFGTVGQDPADKAAGFGQTDYPETPMADN